MWNQLIPGWKQSLVAVCLLTACQGPSASQELFFIVFKDAETGRGIPMVRITTLDKRSLYSDSRGYVAWEDQDLMHTDLYVTISSPGYFFPNDSSGRPGYTLSLRPGAQASISLQRINVAERLYRLTGSGIYYDSERLGLPAPIPQANLNAGVLGQDSNLATEYKGKLFWIWGDTFLPPAYHGNFSVAAATSELPEKGGLAPDVGVDFQYFVDDRGYTKPMIEIEGPGYVWFDWIMNIQNENQEEQLVAKYARVNAYFGNYERGIAVYDDKQEKFEKFQQVDAWLDTYCTMNHPFYAQSAGENYVYLTGEFAFQRVRPNLKALSDPTAYESFTCLQAGATFDETQPLLDRDERGQLIYGWKAHTDAVDYNRLQKLVETQQIEADEVWVQLIDIETGDPVRLSRGSVFWNAYRHKWVLIMGIRDTWYAEADSPVGPWLYARRVAAHDNALYNPLQHPFFDQDGGRVIFFEGTYTRFFNTEGPEVPRYNYNQLMYRLSLDDPRLSLPVPIYELEGSPASYVHGADLPREIPIESVPFFAFDRKLPIAGTLPLYQVRENGQTRLSLQGEGAPLCYVLPTGIDSLQAIRGEWQAHFQIISLNNYTGFTLSQREQELAIKAHKASFVLSEPTYKQGLLRFLMQQEGESYQMEARFKAGKLTGTWENTRTGGKGGWEAKKVDPGWWPAYSPSLRSLYEYRHSETGAYHYSMETELARPGYQRTGNALCRVFHNPYAQVIIDRSMVAAATY